jgi:anti-sigma factor RsiW
MNEHVQHLLAAYFDGELTERQRAQIEAHLSGCPTCQTELENLALLSQMLQADPLPELRTSPDQFVAQVGLRLPRRDPLPRWQRGLNGLWYLIPVGLLAAWLVFQTILAQTWLLELALEYGLLSDLQRFIAADTPAQPLRPFIWNTLFSGIIGTALLGWIASWWVRQQGTPEAS